MSIPLIQQYYQNFDRSLQFGKSRNEQSIRNHFWALLNEYARKFNYEVVPEIAVMGTRGKKVYPDGIRYCEFVIQKPNPRVLTRF